jgi:hypothetical protein
MPRTASAAGPIARAEPSLDAGDGQIPRWAQGTGPARPGPAREPAGYRRVHALTLTQVAQTQAAQGHAEQARASWSTRWSTCPASAPPPQRHHADARPRGHLRPARRPGATDRRGTHLLITQ